MVAVRHVAQTHAFLAFVDAERSGGINVDADLFDDVAMATATNTAATSSTLAASAAVAAAMTTAAADSSSVSSSSNTSSSVSLADSPLGPRPPLTHQRSQKELFAEELQHQPAFKRDSLSAFGLAAMPLAISVVRRSSDRAVISFSESVCFLFCFSVFCSCCRLVTVSVRLLSKRPPLLAKRVVL
jgi:hypothetical protein